MLDAFVLQALREGGGQGLHGKAPWPVPQSLQLAQAVAEVVVGVAGHVHVPQGEVHPAEREKKKNTVGRLCDGFQCVHCIQSPPRRREGVGRLGLFVRDGQKKINPFQYRFLNLSIGR